MHIAPDPQATRKRNMDARRLRILEEAGAMLAAGGMEGLTLRGVATRAGVTVPTIYNLIGGKETVVAALIGTALDAQDAALAALPPCRGLARAEAAAEASLALYLGAPERYAGLFRALSELEANAACGALAGEFERAATTYARAVAEAQEAGDLRGALAAPVLGRHIVHGQIDVLRRWAAGGYSTDSAHAAAHYALITALLADAAKPGRKKLLAKLAPHEAVLAR